MKKSALATMLLALATHASPSFALEGKWMRNGNILEKPWDGKSVVIPGKIVSPPNRENCSDEFPDPDIALEFDITPFSRAAGATFDVNKIYVDGISFHGKLALIKWLDNWESKTSHRNLPPIDGLDWREGGGRKKVLVCVGFVVRAQTLELFGVEGYLQSIVFWYDDPKKSTTISNQPPENGQPPHSEGNAKNMANTEDALKVSKNGMTLRDLNAMPRSGSSQGVISGPRVDLEPDFDIYDTFGHEVSANCNDCMGKSVDVGQAVRAKLKTQVSNADADGFKRSSSSNTHEF